MSAVIEAICAAIVYQLDREWCPAAPTDDLGHCAHWYDCEPCHRCGWDGDGDGGCDCPHHNPGLYDGAAEGGQA